MRLGASGMCVGLTNPAEWERDSTGNVSDEQH